MTSCWLGPPPLIPPHPVMSKPPAFTYHLQSPYDPVTQHRTVYPQPVQSHPTYCPCQDDSYLVSRASSPSPSLPPSFLSVSKTLPSVAHFLFLLRSMTFFLGTKVFKHLSVPMGLLATFWTLLLLWTQAVWTYVLPHLQS